MKTIENTKDNNCRRQTAGEARSLLTCIAWVGLRTGQMALRPWLWLTATVGWNMDRAYDVLREWHLTLEKKVELNEDE